MAEFYVDVTRGDDSRGGQDPARPLRTITAATMNAEAAGGSGTIHVAAGTYIADPQERFPIHVPPRYSLRGAGRDATTIVFTGESITPGGGTIPYWGGTAVHAASGVFDLTIEAAPVPPTFGCSATYGIYVTEDGAQIENVRVHARAGVPPEDGFLLGVTSGNNARAASAPRHTFSIAESRIERCRQSGIFAPPDRVMVRNCVLSSFEGGGISDTSVALWVGWGTVEETTIDDVSDGMLFEREGDVARCSVTALNPSPLRGITQGISSNGLCRIEDCDVITGPGYPVGGAPGRIINSRIEARPGRETADVQAGENGLVDGCQITNCRIVARRVERCTVSRTDAVARNFTYIAVAASGGLALVSRNRLEGAYIDVSSIRSEVIIGNNQIEKAMWGIRIADSNRVTIAENTLEEISEVGLLISGSLDTYVRDNVIKKPSYFTSRLVEIKDGATPAFEGNSFGSRSSDRSQVVITAITIESPADFGGPRSFGGNHFGPLEYTRLITADIPGGGTIMMRNNFWPRGEAIVETSPGTLVDTTGARPDPVTEL